jgi:hypothetical protein
VPRQIAVHCGQHLLAQIVALQQVAELAHRRLVRRRLAAQVDAHKPAHGKRVVKRILDRRIGQVEPLLQEINAQHPLYADRRTTVAGLGIMRLDQSHQLRPTHYPIHLREKLRTTRLPPKSLKPSRHRQRLLLHPITLNTP